VANENHIEGKIDKNKIPAHIAIIMDGNGRWATEKGLPRHEGHRQGVEVVREIVRYCSKLNLKALTLYAFSTENWKRPLSEVNYLMSLPEKYLKEELPELIKNKVVVKVIGDQDKLPDKVRRATSEAVKKTAENDGMILNFAFNYGSRAEILTAVRKIVAEAEKGKIKKIDEKLFSSYLYTAEIPDPDLLIRTSGEKRISNFLLWQIAYAELWFTDVYWPDFKPDHLLEAIYDYQSRKRKFGKI